MTRDDDGVPVARVTPVGLRRVLTATQRAALERLHAAAREGLDLCGAAHGRDALHER